MLSFIKNSYQMRIPMRKLFSSYVTDFDKDYSKEWNTEHSMDSFEKILRVKDVVRSIMSSPSGSCLCQECLDDPRTKKCYKRVL